MKLLAQAAFKFLLGVGLCWLLLFVPAGGLHYPNAWLFSGLLFLPMLGVGLVLWKKAPDLLRKRLNTREKAGTQKRVVLASALLFAVGFVVAGLDFRFGWSSLPPWVTPTASVVFLLAYAMYAEVLRENAYLSRTVELQESQKLVDSGLYAVVRHPMYAAASLLFLSMPLVLGSVWAVVVFLPVPLLLAARIRDEEALLLEGLAGYREYTQRVRFRMIPFIW